VNVLIKPEVITTIDGLRERIAQARNRAESGRPARVVLVPTMGALHAGHLSLVRRARTRGDIVVVSIFVNPLQFGPTEDLASYPRTLDADIAALAAEGVAFVFAPEVATMYPAGAADTRVTAGPVAALLEGSVRPGHFDGMLTVVTKLVNIVGPDVVVFGQKDAQQVFLVQQAFADLNVRTEIEVVPIVREETGLALSSRNRRLETAEKEAALALSAALAAAAAAAAAGVQAARTAAQVILAAQPLVKLDYLVVVSPQDFQPVAAGFTGPARMLVAAHVGSVRLIDNEALDLGSAPA
jgi:pantoate--beta-alanine ligase